MNLRDYIYLGTTHSLCPHCRRLVDAKIIVRHGRVYFRKRCPEHGTFEDFVCSDVAYYDRHEFSQPARLPRAFGTRPDKGCPYDCGLCTEHEQHTCIALVEITSGCNLKCPMCFAESGPGGQHLDFETYCRMVDRYVHLEGAADVLQISGGEPTLHPDLVRMVRYAYEKPIAVVMINTNGIRLAHDERLLEALAEMRDKFEVYLQFDALDDAVYRRLRGEDLLAAKLKALEALERYNLRCTLVCTVEHNSNLHELGRVVRFGLERSIVRGISFQLATYCGRHVQPGDLERRATMPDVVKALVGQTGGLVEESDFYPLPCAHPNCHMMCYLYRGGGKPVPISRLIDVRKHLHPVANSVVYTPERARLLVSQYLEEAGGCGCGPNGCGPQSPLRPSEPLTQKPLTPRPPLPLRGEGEKDRKKDNQTVPRTAASAFLPPLPSVGEGGRGGEGFRGREGTAGGEGDRRGLDDFVVKALAEKLNGAEVFRITLTAFLDAHTFDTRRVMKCCLAHLLPSGHVVPFCAYNTLYRDGYVPLPPLADSTRRSLTLVDG